MCDVTLLYQDLGENRKCNPPEAKVTHIHSERLPLLRLGPGSVLPTPWALIAAQSDPGAGGDDSHPTVAAASGATAAGILSVEGMPLFLGDLFLQLKNGWVPIFQNGKPVF